MKEISPELALIDPELAAEARTLLPEPASAAAGRSARRERRRRSLRRRRLMTAAVFVALGLAAAAFAVVSLRTDEEVRRPSSAPAPASSPQGQVPRQLPPAGTAAAEPRPKQTRAAAAPKPSVEPAPAAAVLGARRKVKSPPSSSVPATGRPARLYLWGKTEGAVYYHVAFVRNGKPFHSAQTADPWLRVPDTLRFPPGTYRWSVRPAVVGDSGVVVGDAVVVRTFRVGAG